MTDVDGNPIAEPDYSLFTFEEVNSKADNPQETFDKDNETYAYTVNVYYNGIRLVDTEKAKPVQFTVYIGLKGDANLDRIVDAKDASSVLAYYSTLQTGVSANEALLNEEDDERIKANPILDHFAAFLADVDLDVYNVNNWKMMKSDREVDAKDASWILAYYSIMSTGETDPHKGWNETFADGLGFIEETREVLFDKYIDKNEYVD